MIYFGRIIVSSGITNSKSRSSRRCLWCLIVCNNFFLVKSNIKIQENDVHCSFNRIVWYLEREQNEP